jgi:hypothetical protein
MHSVEYNYAPSSFDDVWTKNYVIQGDRPLRNADDFTLPNPRTELFLKKLPLYEYTLPLEWNNLDATKYIYKKCDVMEEKWVTSRRKERKVMEERWQRQEGAEGKMIKL